MAHPPLRSSTTTTPASACTTAAPSHRSPSLYSYLVIIFAEQINLRPTPCFLTTLLIALFLYTGTRGISIHLVLQQYPGTTAVLYWYFRNYSILIPSKLNLTTCVEYPNIGRLREESVRGCGGMGLVRCESSTRSFVHSFGSVFVYGWVLLLL